MKSLVLKQLKNHYNFKKDVDLAKFLDITPQMLSNWDSRDTFDYSVIYRKCVDINPDWILSKGKGEISRNKDTQKEYKNTPINSNILNSINYGNKIPIVNASIITSVKNCLNDIVQNPFDYITLPLNMIQPDSTYLCVRKLGDSMSPTLSDSDIIIIRLINSSEWANIPNEQIFIVTDENDHYYIRRIKKIPNEKFFVCSSDNVDKANFPTFNLDESDIQSIWKVELQISSKMTNINDNYYNKLKQIEDRLDILSQKIDSEKSYTR
jgi:phage repressor protein C with HTH and peptisase S24 domain